MFDNGLFLLQIAVIVGFSHLIAAVFHRPGQPRVVGEMAAGIALGPTLFGFLAPGAYHALFPTSSLGFLNAVSQGGLTICVFLVGVRVDFAELRRQSGIAVVTSNISVIVPLTMGIACAQYLFPRYGSGSRFLFALFSGTAMSVTAFLFWRASLWSAICSGHGWDRCSNGRPAWLMLVQIALYLAAMVVLGRILNAWSNSSKNVLSHYQRMDRDPCPGGRVHRGPHYPRKFRQLLIDKLDTVTLLLFVPIYFALTGIRTSLIFRAGTGSYLDLLLILLVAIASKLGGTMIGARAKGMGWQDACQLGLMMNTRGLVELIVLNLGLNIGILSPALFSMMVLMALVTTGMATPLMDWVGGAKLKAEVATQT